MQGAECAADMLTRFAQEEEVMPLIVKERLAEYEDKLRPQIVTIINLGTAAEEKVCSPSQCHHGAVADLPCAHVWP